MSSFDARNSTGDFNSLDRIAYQVRNRIQHKTDIKDNRQENNDFTCLEEWRNFSSAHKTVTIYKKLEKMYEKNPSKPLSYLISCFFSHKKSKIKHFLNLSSRL